MLLDDPEKFDQTAREWTEKYAVCQKRNESPVPDQKDEEKEDENWTVFLLMKCAEINVFLLFEWSGQMEFQKSALKLLQSGRESRTAQGIQLRWMLATLVSILAS